MSDTPLLRLDEVSRIYGEEVKVHALDGVSLDIKVGEFVSIVGPSGSGKSTMLGLLGLLDLPSLGTLSVDGTSVADLSDHDRSTLRGEVVGFIFQQFHLIPHLDARRNVETALLYRQMSPRERKRRAMDALEVVGLAPRHEHRPVQMSGGEQQRCAIARAIVTEPKLLLADEPTGALDSTNAANVMEIFRDLNDGSRAIAIVTHDPAVAASADRRISMKDGKIVADDQLSGGATVSSFGGTLGSAREKRPRSRRRRRRWPHGAVEPHPADHARADHRRERNRRRRGAHRVSQGRPPGDLAALGDNLIRGEAARPSAPTLRSSPRTSSSASTAWPRSRGRRRPRR